MRNGSKRIFLAAGMLTALLPLGGCFIAADLLSPAAITTLGFDPNSIFQPSGTVIVVFVNETDQPAIFSAFKQTDPADESTALSFQVEVDPGSNSNEVLGCPTGRISLGSPALVGQDNVSAVVGAATVNYTGDAVSEGIDYLCGDNIVYTVSPAAGGAQDAFVITARIIPGR